MYLCFFVVSISLDYIRESVFSIWGTCHFLLGKNYHSAVRFKELKIKKKTLRLLLHQTKTKKPEKKPDGGIRGVGFNERQVLSQMTTFNNNYSLY